MKVGNLIISLDFELHWGSIEKVDIKQKKSYFDKAREGVPLILALFKKYNIHATWATVGLLFAENKKQMLEYIPINKPTYSNPKYNYYRIIDENSIGDNEHDDPYHFAQTLISKIIAAPYQELATHTFSHYYCNEIGQLKSQFGADLRAAQALAKQNFNIELKSLVFPRNQFNSEYLAIAKQNGIKVVRSNPDVWFWKRESKLTRLARAFDTLMPISKSLSYYNTRIAEDEMLLLPSSRFFRPYSQNEKSIQYLKHLRIKKEMLIAARYNKIYHIWWHPHNYGNYLKENLVHLDDILMYYQELKIEYGFESRSMVEMYQQSTEERTDADYII